MSSYVLKVALRDVRPIMWRRVRVPGDATLSDLHDVFRIVLGWTGSESHSFRIGKKVVSEDTLTLEAIAKKHDAFVYVYDLRDGVEHDVTIEKAVKKPTALECLGGEHVLPPAKKLDLDAINEALVEYVMSKGGPVSDPAELEALTTMLDEALRKDPEALVTVRARVVANLIRDLLSGAIEVSDE